LKQYTCVKVGDHKDIGDAVDEWQQKGWRLHTYACAGAGMPVLHHYLLFEKGECTKNKGLLVRTHYCAYW
jgi:hypothetical protein